MAFIFLFCNKQFKYIGIENYTAIYKYIQFLQGNRNGHSYMYMYKPGAYTPLFMAFIIYITLKDLIIFITVVVCLNLRIHVWSFFYSNLR
jgi:hypothetical protein